MFGKCYEYEKIITRKTFRVRKTPGKKFSYPYKPSDSMYGLLNILRTY